MLQFLTVHIKYKFNYFSTFILLKIKDMKPCPPNMFFNTEDYAVKVFPHDERFPL